jgi:predicted DNA binding CopG/RHH family protein
MKRKKPVEIDAPRFRSEAEEADWWDSHQDLVADLLLKHGRRAALPLKSVTLRLPVTDIDKARQLAAARGIGYQTLIKVLLHDALKREERSTRSTS